MKLNKFSLLSSTLSIAAIIGSVAATTVANAQFDPSGVIKAAVVSPNLPGSLSWPNQRTIGRDLPGPAGNVKGYWTQGDAIYVQSFLPITGRYAYSLLIAYASLGPVEIEIQDDSATPRSVKRVKLESNGLAYKVIDLNRKITKDTDLKIVVVGGNALYMSHVQAIVDQELGNSNESSPAQPGQTQPVSNGCQIWFNANDGMYKLIRDGGRLVAQSLSGPEILDAAGDAIAARQCNPLLLKCDATYVAPQVQQQIVVQQHHHFRQGAPVVTNQQVGPAREVVSVPIWGRDSIQYTGSDHALQFLERRGVCR